MTSHSQFSKFDCFVRALVGQMPLFPAFKTFVLFIFGIHVRTLYSLMFEIVSALPDFDGRWSFSLDKDSNTALSKIHGSIDQCWAQDTCRFMCCILRGLTEGELGLVHLDKILNIGCWIDAQTTQFLNFKFFEITPHPYKFQFFLTSNF